MKILPCTIGEIGALVGIIIVAVLMFGIPVTIFIALWKFILG